MIGFCLNRVKSFVSLIGPHSKTKKRLTVDNHAHRSDKRRDKDSKKDSSEAREKKRRTNGADHATATGTTNDKAPAPTMNALDILGAENLPAPSGKGSNPKTKIPPSISLNNNNSNNNNNNSLAIRSHLPGLGATLPSSGSPSALLSPLLPRGEVLAGVVLYISKPLAQRQAELVNIGTWTHINLFVLSARLCSWMRLHLGNERDCVALCASRKTRKHQGLCQSQGDEVG